MKYEKILAGLRDWLRQYIDSFDRSIEDVRVNFELKRDHSLRVCAEMRQIAVSLKMTPDEIALAEIMALLHDVGRFEQYHRYRSYMDNDEIDHGNMGVAVLRDLNPLHELPEEERELVIAAVGAHNKLNIPDNIVGRGRHFTRMLRDADKLDIWKVVLEFYRSDRSNPAVKLHLHEDHDLSPTVYNAIMAGKLADKRDMRCLCDFQATQLAWVYDLNFPWTLQCVKQRRYLQQVISCMKPSPEADRIYSRAVAYLHGQSQD